jgi:hypothetical protein
MEINSSGLIFPDGSVQTTASPVKDIVNGSGTTVSSSSGIYSIDVTASGISGEFDKISFNTGLGDPDLEKGELAWNNSEGSLALATSDTHAVFVGEEMLYRIRNNSGSILRAGVPVYASGLTPGGNNRIEVAPYVADGSVREIRFMGLMMENCDDDVNGYATHFGYIRRIDTRGDASANGTTNKLWTTGEPTWAEGDILYVHPTVPGKLTKIEPKHSISVAMVLNRHQNEGKLFVRPLSYGHLGDNHDVAVSGATNGQFLQYNSVTDYWVPSSSGSFTVLNVDNLRLDGNSITSTNSNGNIIIQPSGDGALQRNSAGNARGDYAVDLQGVLGFNDRVASGLYSVVGGGGWNSAGDTSVVAGGFNNRAVGSSCFIGGGQVNVASGEYSCILGGSNNVGSGDYGAILGGYYNNDGGYDHVFILGSGITASQSNTSYVENIIGTGYAKFDQLHPTVISNGNVSGNVPTFVSTGQIFDMTLTGSITLTNPINKLFSVENPADGVTVRWRITQDGTGGHSVTLGDKFVIPSSATSPLPWSTSPNAMDVLAATYHAGRDKWDVVAFVPGY